MDRQCKQGRLLRDLKGGVLLEIQGVAVLRPLPLIQGLPLFPGHHLLPHQGLVHGKALLPVRGDRLDADVLPPPETLHELLLTGSQRPEGPGALQAHLHDVPGNPVIP